MHDTKGESPSLAVSDCVKQVKRDKAHCAVAAILLFWHVVKLALQSFRILGGYKFRRLP